MFYKLFQNIASVFRGKNLIWQGIMIALTAFFVLSGFDWWYYSTTRGMIQNIGFSAALFGFFVPSIVPLYIYTVSAVQKNVRLRNTANAIVQAELLGLAISSFYKIFTGRAGLPHVVNMIDTSRTFLFGIYRGGAFQGWPSSHTSVAFGMSIVLITLYPEKKWLRFIAIAYAIYIGLGVSVSIHWFSDFVAGAILGSIIGITIGKRFLEKNTPASSIK